MSSSVKYEIVEEQGCMNQEKFLFSCTTYRERNSEFVSSGKCFIANTVVDVGNFANGLRFISTSEDLPVDV
jgi:outer membrane protease